MVSEGADVLLSSVDLRSARRTMMAAVFVPVAVAVFLVAWIILPWWAGLLAGLVAGAVVLWWRLGNGPEQVLARMGAAEVDPATQPRLANLLEGLCATAGLPEPRLALADHPSVNAAAVGGGQDAWVVFTSGALHNLDRVALEALTAQQLTRIRSGRADLLTTAHGLVGWLLGSGYMERWSRGQADQRADLDATDLTRYPPGLISAYETMAEVGAAVPGAHPSTALLWCVDPIESPSVPATPSTDTSDRSLARRLDLLREIA